MKLFVPWEEILKLNLNLKALKPESGSGRAGGNMSNSVNIVRAPIKCQGIKNKLVQSITAAASPQPYARWVEPFAGSGVVAFNQAPAVALLADLNPHIINFYKGLQRERYSRTQIKKFLTQEGARLAATQGAHYYELRARFNANFDPLDFLFLNRSCFNGIIRFNRSGGFNVPFCKKPERFSKSYVTKICNQAAATATIIKAGEFEFKCQNWRATLAERRPGDFIYCDPPYNGRNNTYHDNWNENDEAELAEQLAASSNKFMVSSWYADKYKENPSMKTVWKKFNIQRLEHYYHVGPRQDNRGKIIEALITNY